MLIPDIFERSFLDDFWGTDYPVQRRADVDVNTLMRTDVKEYDDAYELYINLPGYRKEDIRAEVKKGYLVINASVSQNKEEKDEKTGKYIRRERYSGSCSRSFYVGKDIMQEDIKAKFENGVLTLRIPKKDAKKPEIEEKNYITIEG